MIVYIFLFSQCSCSTQGGDQKQDPCHRENGQNVLCSQVHFMSVCVKSMCMCMIHRGEGTPNTGIIYIREHHYLIKHGRD